MPNPTRLDRPIIVIGCNRSGTTLLFNNLSWHPDTWSLYIESQDIFYRHFPIHPEQGDAVGPGAPATVLEQIRNDFYRSAHNKEIFKDTALLRHIPRKLLQRPLGKLYRPASIRLVEKTPANCFRIPLLCELFPDARFLFLVRRGEDVVSSLMEGWKNWSKSPPTGWQYTRWHYLVPPGWQSHRHSRLEEICAFQWVESNLTAWRDLQQWAPGRFLLLHHEQVMREPAAAYRNILDFCEVRPSAFLDLQIARIENRVFTTGGSKPRQEKWKQLHQAEIASVMTLLEPVNRLFDETPGAASGVPGAAG